MSTGASTALYGLPLFLYWLILRGSEDLSTDRAHFLRIYEELVRRENECRISFQLAEVNLGIPLPRLSLAFKSTSEQLVPGE